jgi:hypothetical protein
MELICVSCKEKNNQHALYHLSIIRKLYNDSCFVQFDIPEKKEKAGGGGGGGGGAIGAPPPPPPKIGKNMIFWHKIVIFHTKYPKQFRTPSARRIFLSAQDEIKTDKIELNKFHASKKDPFY